MVKPRSIPRETTGFVWFEALHYAGLWGVAIAQPIFDTLGRSPEFFVAHNTRLGDLLKLVLVLCAVGPTCCFLVTRAFSRLGPRWHQLSVGVVVGVLVTAIALEAVKQLAYFDTALSLVVAGAFGLAVVTGYLWSSPVHTFMTFLSPAAIVVPTVFLLNPAISSLLSTFDHRPIDGVTFTATHPVVVVVFDQLPLASLLDRDGQIDRRLYPNFSKLGDNATWFRNASAVSGMTASALPAIVTGSYPTPGRLPIVEDHPANLFTLFGSRYRLQALEPLTDLCPETICETKRAGVVDWWVSVLSDITVVYLQRVFPVGLTASLPPVTQNWKNFASFDNLLGRWSRRRVDDRREVVDGFIGSIAANSDSARPSLYFMHVLLPHEPWLYLQSGQRFTTTRHMIGLQPDGRWVDGEWAGALNYQRHLLQVKYADSVLGTLVERLRTVGVYDDALIVVTSDHGANFRPGLSFREPTETSFTDIASVPLFIKRSGQRNGSIVTANIESIDIVPTLAAELGVRPPWDADGLNAFASTLISRPTKTMFFDDIRRKLVAPSDLSDALEASVARKFELFETGDPINQPSWGGYDELVGKAVADFQVRRPGNIEVVIDALDLLGDVDHGSDFVPAHITGAVVARRGVHVTTPLAISINGVLAAVTRVYTFSVGGRRNMWEAIVNPSLLEQGANAVEVFVVREGSDGAVVLEETYTENTNPPRANVAREEAPELWGVASSGFYQTEWEAHRAFRWTNGAAHLSVPIDPQDPPSQMAVEVLMTGPMPKHLQIVVNGCTLFDETIWSIWTQMLALDECLVESASVEIDLLTSVHTPMNDSRTLGVGVASVELHGGKPLQIIRWHGLSETGATLFP